MEDRWYYAENGQTIGPASRTEIAARIRQGNGRRHFVWTEGMPGWVEASAVPEFLLELNAGAPKPVVAASQIPPAGKSAKLRERARRELRQYLLTSAYLCICFAALLFYKATILGSEGIAFAPFGLAVVKALILGKFMLVLESMKIGDREQDNGALFLKILKKASIFTILLFFLTILEELGVGHLHGRSSREILREIAGGTLAEAVAVGLLMFLVLVPYFAYREIAAKLGEDALAKLLFARASPEAGKAEAENRS